MQGLTATCVASPAKNKVPSTAAASWQRPGVSGREPRKAVRSDVARETDNSVLHNHSFHIVVGPCEFKRGLSVASVAKLTASLSPASAPIEGYC